MKIEMVEVIAICLLASVMVMLFIGHYQNVKQLEESFERQVEGLCKLEKTINLQREKINDNLGEDRLEKIGEVYCDYLEELKNDRT